MNPDPQNKLCSNSKIITFSRPPKLNFGELVVAVGEMCKISHTSISVIYKQLLINTDQLNN